MLDFELSAKWKRTSNMKLANREENRREEN
jgi:hypothetical protein